MSSYSTRLFLSLQRETGRTLDKDNYMKLWRWIDGKWTIAQTEQQRVDVLMMAINSVDKEFPDINLLEKMGEVRC